MNKSIFRIAASNLDLGAFEFHDFYFHIYRQASQVLASASL